MTDAPTRLNIATAQEAPLLRVNEIFGPTLQGEGPSIGRPAVFLRLAGCNLTCVWCDTPYTWDWKGQNGKVYDRTAETHPHTVDDVMLTLMDHLREGDLLVVSGGEPLIQQRALERLVMLLPHEVEIETNGTRQPTEWLAGMVHRFNVSPKLENAGCEGSWRPDVLDGFPDHTILKFVVSAPEDFAEIETKLADLTVPRETWVMPEGTRPEVIIDRLSWVFDEAANRGWNVTPRLHVLAHGGRRAV